MKDKLPLRSRSKTCLIDAHSSLFHPFWAQNILRKVGEVIRTLRGHGCALIFSGIFIPIKISLKPPTWCPSIRSCSSVQERHRSLKRNRRPGEHGFYNLVVYIWKLELQGGTTVNLDLFGD